MGFIPGAALGLANVAVHWIFIDMTSRPQPLWPGTTDVNGLMPVLFSMPLMAALQCAESLSISLLLNATVSAWIYRTLDRHQDVLDCWTLLRLVGVSSGLTFARIITAAGHLATVSWDYTLPWFFSQVFTIVLCRGG